MKYKIQPFALLIPLIVFSFCKKEVVPAPLNYMSLKTNGSDTIVADGYSTLEITAVIDTALMADKKPVSFTTSIGSFLEGSSTANVNEDNHGMAKVHLKGTTLGAANVLATVNTSMTVSKNIYFSTAWPDIININTAASLSHALGSKLSVTAKCSRNQGLVSQGIPVQFSVTDALGNSKGAFYNITPTDASGAASAEFWLQDTLYTGFIFISAQVVTNKNAAITGKTKVLVVK